jgi:hypothetical protein
LYTREKNVWLHANVQNICSFAVSELFAAQLCEMCHEHSAKEDVAGLEVTGGAAARLEESHVASDAITHEGHIAGPETEDELKSDERADLLRQPHASEGACYAATLGITPIV